MRVQTNRQTLTRAAKWGERGCAARTARALSGAVTDTQGLALSGVTVTLTGAARGIVRRGVTSYCNW